VSCALNATSVSVKFPTGGQSIFAKRIEAVTLVPLPGAERM